MSRRCKVAAIVRTDAAGNFLWGNAVVGVKNGIAGYASYEEVIHYRKNAFAMTGRANGQLSDQDILLGKINISSARV